MESLIPTNEYTEVDGRVYANPQVGIDETNTFIDNLRATQGQQNQEITQQTQNLGTNIPTNLGGLTGANSYFTSRYQTPQTNNAVANLRAAAQASAMQQALENEQEIWKKKYQDAYRAYQKREYDKANQPSSTNTSGDTTIMGGVDENDTSEADTFDYSNSVAGVNGAYTVIDIAGNAHLVPFGKDYEEEYVYSDTNKKNSGSNGRGFSGGGVAGGGGTGGR